MAKPYPIELRERVIAAYENGEGSFRELGERFLVGEATVNRWVSRKRRTGTVAASAMGGRRRAFAVDAKGEAFIEWVLAEVPDSSAVELVAAYQEEFGVSVSQSSMKRTLHRLGYTRKRGRSDLQRHGVQTFWRKGRSS